MTDVTLDLRGVAQTKALLAEFDGAKLNNRTRRALRAGVKPIREEMRRQASSGKFPRKFRSTRTRAHRNPLGVSVSPKSPLSSIFEHGARSHRIAPVKAAVLSNFETRRQAGPASRALPFFARGAVQHPGMAARPFIAPSFEAAKDAAEKAVSDVLFEGL